MTDMRVIEAMLLRWGENHASGRTVTFQLPEDDSPHPFKGLACGPSNGQRLALSIALIADDETVTEPAEQPEPAKTKVSDIYNTSLAQEAGILCSQSSFYEFLEREWSEPLNTAIVNLLPGSNSNEISSKCVRYICHVQSRSEFDTDPEAAKRWIELRGQYNEWLVA